MCYNFVFVTNICNHVDLLFSLVKDALDTLDTVIQIKQRSETFLLNTMIMSSQKSSYMLVFI